MRFRVLGPLEVADEERRLPVGSAQQRVVLAVLLAARGEVVSADRLVDALWGTTPPTSARRSLHSHVSRLRRILAASTDATTPIVTETDGYRVDLQRHDVDADRFEVLLARGREELDAAPERAVRRLDEALGLWRGVAFGELATRDAVRAEAVRLEGLRAAAAAVRIDARLSIGDHQTVIADLEAAVDADRLDERPHGQLMLALYRSGRQVDALGVYRRLQRRLGEEVGVDPSPELARLHQRILQQDTELAAPPQVPVAASRSATSGSAPLRTTPPQHDEEPDRTADDHGLIGRDDAVAAVAHLITSHPLVTLAGTGGVGKSSLSAAVVARVCGAFADGVVIAALAGVRDPDSVPAALVDALGVQQQGIRSTEETVLASLGTRRLLLVLDNCEHLLPSVASMIERIRGACPHVAVLATSREYLRLPGERVWEVTPLPVPAEDADAAEVAATPAGALFCARARQVEATFALTETNAPTIAQLCRRLDGLPLAVELAAARTRALALEAIADRIDDRFHVLTGGSHRGPGRHRTLHAMVAWSYEMLTDAEARLFDRLSVFAGSFSLAAAEQVAAGDPLTSRQIAGLLAELVDKSLVTVDRADGGVRYRLLDTLRAFGAERLEETGATDRVRRTHAAHHVRLVQELAPAVRGPDEGAALAQLDAALDDLRVAHAWMIAGGDVDGALRLPAALDDDLVFRPRAEVFAWAERARMLPDAQRHPAYPAATAVAARAALNRGELDGARRLAESALTTAEPDSLATLSASYVLTTAALYEGHLDVALALADRRVALADSLGQDFHRALAGVSRVLALRYRGEVDAASQAASEARRDAEASGSHTAQAWALYANGEALSETAPDQAAVLLEEAIAAAQRVDRRFIAGVALVSLASLHGRRGRTDRALRLFRETVAHWRSLGVDAQQLTTLRNLVELLVRVGDDEPAAVLLGAVTAGATPSFGAEADRLAAARHHLVQRLGADHVDAAAERGRQLTLPEVVDLALGHLDALLDDASGAPGSASGSASGGAPGSASGGDAGGDAGGAAGGAARLGGPVTDALRGP